MTHFKSRLAGAVLIIAGLLIGGCLTVPLGDPEKSKVDEAYIGFWINSRPGGDDGKLLVVQAFDTRTFLITHYNFKQTASGVEQSGGKMTFKAWLTPVEAQRFITLERMDAGRIMRVEDKPYVVAKVEMETTTITCTPIDPKFVDDNKVTTAEMMMAMVSKHLDDPKMYGEKEVYEKLSADRLNEAKDILSAFGESYD